MQVGKHVQMPCPTAPAGMLLDSCPCSPGLDDVTNFMDEGPDSCLRSFSMCQARRMHGAYWRYRAQENNASGIQGMVVQARFTRASGTLLHCITSTANRSTINRCIAIMQQLPMAI